MVIVVSCSGYLRWFGHGGNCGSRGDRIVSGDSNGAVGVLVEVGLCSW